MPSQSAKPTSIGAEKRAGYTRQEKQLIKQAETIIRERQKLKEDTVATQKEGIVEIVEQKKEMFLVEMTVGIMKNEIERLKQISQEKQQILDHSEKMLQVDKERFYNFYEDNKMKKKRAEDVRHPPHLSPSPGRRGRSQAPQGERSDNQSIKSTFPAIDAHNPP
jgi:hypothetical protein